MSEGDRMNHTNNNEAQNPNVPVKRTSFLYILLVLGIIGAGVLDFPRNIVELTEIGFSLSWGIALAIPLSLFRIFKYLAFPFFIYYLLVDILKIILKDGLILSKWKKIKQLNLL